MWMGGTTSSGLSHQLLAELPPDLRLTLGRRTLRYDDVQDELRQRGWSLKRMDAQFVDEIVRWAAENRRMSVLRLLEHAGVWKPAQSTLALEAAHEAGTVVPLLQSFQLPLGAFPAIAMSNEADAVLALLSDSSTEPDRMTTTPSGHVAPPRSQANLLANYLLVPGPCAEELVQATVEQMIVFHPIPSVKALKPDNAMFPESLPPVTLKSVMGAGKATLIAYDRQKHTMQPPGSRRPLKTSTEALITLTDASREAALIPPTAQAVVYLYGSGEMAGGGLMFLDSSRTPCGVSEFQFQGSRSRRSSSFNAARQQSTVLTFGAPAKVPDHFLERLQEQARDVEETSLKERGARQCAWVCPEEASDDFPDPGRLGGLVFFCEGHPAVFFGVVGAGRSAKTQLQLQSKIENLDSLPKMMNFPETLGAIYLRREVTVSDGRSSRTIVYQRERHELTMGASLLRTSAEYPMTLKGVERRSACVPLQAELYTYIYYGTGFDTGGFLYLSAPDAEGNVRPLAVNSIAFDHRRHAFSFGSHVHVPAGAAAVLKKRAQAISVPVLLEQGATHYTWVGPNEEFRDFRAGPAGGFAYFFDDQAKDRYFPLNGAAEVVDRANMVGDISCDCLPKDAGGLEVETYITSVRRVTVGSVLKSLASRVLGEDPLADGGIEVGVARLRVPDPLHPMVLHALAFTPRRQVLTTIFAKAVAQHAFRLATSHMVLMLTLEMLSIGGTTFVAQVVRSGELLDGDSGSRMAFMLWSLVISFVWAKNVLAEIFLLTGYLRRSWAWDYFTKTVILYWMHMGLMFWLVVWLCVGVVTGFDGIDGTVRPLLASIGCINWVRVLYMCRGFEQFRIGPRVLPIFAALTEVGDFVLITLFFAMSCAHAAFSLSHASITYTDILFSVYRLGFLGDFSTNADVLYLPSLNAEPMPTSPFQYASFVIFSFVISISLTNIFIGVMSNAFDFHQERVTELFVRNRAKLGLHHTLMKEGAAFWIPCSPLGFLAGVLMRILRGPRPSESSKKRRDYLWVSYPKNDDDQVGAADITLRGALYSVKSTIEESLGAISDQVGGVAKRLEAMGPRPEADMMLSETSQDVLSEEVPELPAPSAAKSAQMVRVQQLADEKAEALRPTQQLRLHIQYAKGLRNADGFFGLGSSDPYCTCDVVGKASRVQTQVIPDTLDPVWNFRCEMSVHDGDTLLFQVWDKDVGKTDDFLGRVSLKVDGWTGWSGELDLEEGGDGITAVLAVELELDTPPKTPALPQALLQAVDGVQESLSEGEFQSILPGEVAALAK